MNKSKKLPSELKSKINKIKVLALDVDGVFTNGKIYLDYNGKEIKAFHSQDGLGIVLLREAGIQTAIISARQSDAVSARAKELKIDKVYQAAYPKDTAFEKLLKHFGVGEEEVCFVGDDLPDICLLRKVGLSVAVNNAVAEVKSVVDYVTSRFGGDGAIREVAELILKVQNKWPYPINKD